MKCLCKTSLDIDRFIKDFSCFRSIAQFISHDEGWGA